MGAVIPYDGVDGVAGAWYGKGPGLDRWGDALKHANSMGAGPNGGAVMFCGDDPGSKPSTLSSDSQYTFEDACVPVLFPGDQQDVLDLGVHAFRLSRYAGAWAGLKIVTSVAGEVVVIEEKRPFIETQLRALLHEAGRRAPVSGKRDRSGQVLAPSAGELDPDVVAAVLTRVLPALRRAPVSSERTQSSERSRLTLNGTPPPQPAADRPVLPLLQLEQPPAIQNLGDGTFSRAGTPRSGRASRPARTSPSRSSTTRPWR